jgi:hypothetical protein
MEMVVCRVCHCELSAFELAESDICAICKRNNDDWRAEWRRRQGEEQQDGLPSEAPLRHRRDRGD